MSLRRLLRQEGSQFVDQLGFVNRFDQEISRTGPKAVDDNVPLRYVP
jgi:hypothetical protein